MRGTTELKTDGERVKLVLTGRWIAEKADAGQLYASAAFWLTENISLGADWRPLTDDVGLTATWRAVSEDPDGWRPAVIFGTATDDFTVGDHEIQSRSVFGTLSKALPPIEPLNLTVSPYAGAVWIHELEALRPVGGVVLRHDWGSAMFQYSGTDTHLTLSRSITDNTSLSFVLWGMEMPGIAMRWRW